MTRNSCSDTSGTCIIKATTSLSEGGSEVTAASEAYACIFLSTVQPPSRAETTAKPGHRNCTKKRKHETGHTSRRTAEAGGLISVQCGTPRCCQGHVAGRLRCRGASPVHHPVSHPGPWTPTPPPPHHHTCSACRASCCPPRSAATASCPPCMPAAPALKRR